MQQLPPPSRPFNDDWLMCYSDEHVLYEFNMVLNAAVYMEQPVLRPKCDSAAQATYLNNLIVESYALHLRNVIDFFYPEKPPSNKPPRPTDVVAEDFCDAGKWKAVRPALSVTLAKALTRANKEIAHLTSERIAGRAPEKMWPYQDLTLELRPLLYLLIKEGSHARLGSTFVAYVQRL